MRIRSTRDGQELLSGPQKRRQIRSAAIALLLCCSALLIYAVTAAKLNVNLARAPSQMESVR